jgi:hypothetical protein
MYIPLSNIIEVGFSNGGRFVLQSDESPYVGDYHKDINNRFWTGKTHDSNSASLIDLSEAPSNVTTEASKYISGGGKYTTLLNPKIFPSINFQSDYIQPVDQDYENGFFYRFFLKPVISSQANDFIEVKLDKYNQVSYNEDLRVLYKHSSMLWKLTGPSYDVYDNNIRIEPGIIDSNKRSIQETEKLLPNLSLYLTDPLQFGRPS